MQRATHMADDASIDAATSRAVCDGIGERLRDTLKNDDLVPPQIADLLERLDRQDGKHWDH